MQASHYGCEVMANTLSGRYSQDMSIDAAVCIHSTSRLTITLRLVVPVKERSDCF